MLDIIDGYSICKMIIQIQIADTRQVVNTLSKRMDIVNAKIHKF